MRFGLRETLFFLVLLAMPVATYYLVLLPKNQEIAQAREEMRRRQDKLRQLQVATRQIEDIGREIDKLTKAIDVFEAKLPAEKEVEVILKEVWQLAAKHNLKPRSIRTDKPIKNARYSELPLNMIIVGDFDGYYQFLLDLERLSRITRVTQMSLKKLSGDTEGQMEAAFKLSIYFEPQDGSDRDKDDAADKPTDRDRKTADSRA